MRRRNQPPSPPSGTLDGTDSEDHDDNNDASDKVQQPQHNGAEAQVELDSRAFRRTNSTNFAQMQADSSAATKRQTAMLVLLTIASFVLHFYNISWSNKVVWDEAHFGKFASHYIKRDFYFDVHPPLGKVLLGFSGALGGYNGSFEFDSGAQYPTELNYSIMRIFCAAFGALTVPLAYLTALEFGFSELGALFTGVGVLCDTALLVITRFILLDSLLLFFTATTFFCLSKFNTWQSAEPFCLEWWFWLSLTGASLGSVLSVKWVGLFCVALVGLYTLEQLWTLLAPPTPLSTYSRHWVARIICLIAIPVMVYVFSFWLHFFLLERSGPGDAQMSSLFQANLRGSDLLKGPLEIAYGSTVTLKSNMRAGGLLHSHVQRFPSGSEQQQVTTYHHKDSNNEWKILKPWNQPEPEGIEFIKDGAVVRISHASTEKNLHSHAVKAPVTSGENEVSAYGNLTIGDSNDHWKVELVDDILLGTVKQIQTLTTRFRLRHVNSKCLLRSTGVTLPEWGFKQGEIVCGKTTAASNDDDTSNYWNIEKHVNENLEPMSRDALKSPFWKDFLDLNVAMWQSNNALTPDPDKEPEALVSQFWQWPFMNVGMRMCSWGDDDIKFYLIGNPILWWGSSASLIAWVMLSLLYVILEVRGLSGLLQHEWNYFFNTGKYIFLAWALHFLPFGIMGRVLYLHHYFPALYFSIFMFGFMLDHILYFYVAGGRRSYTSIQLESEPKEIKENNTAAKIHKFQSIRRNARTGIFLFAILTVVAVFWWFSPFVFGFTGRANEMSSRRWNKAWNIHD